MSTDGWVASEVSGWTDRQRDRQVLGEKSKWASLEFTSSCALLFLWTAQDSRQVERGCPGLRCPSISCQWWSYSFADPTSPLSGQLSPCREPVARQPSCQPDSREPALNYKWVSDLPTAAGRAARCPLVLSSVGLCMFHTTLNGSGRLKSLCPHHSSTRSLCESLCLGNCCERCRNTRRAPANPQ